MLNTKYIIQNISPLSTQTYLQVLVACRAGGLYRAQVQAALADSLAVRTLVARRSTSLLVQFLLSQLMFVDMT